MSTQPKLRQTYTIKEASERCGLPESTLRYYESIGIIDKIGRDFSSKHRVYNEGDIDTLDAIACLNATGMSLDDMRLYIENRTHGKDAAKDQIKLFEDQVERLKAETVFLALREKYVKIKLSYWQAVESGNDSLALEISDKAKSLARDLKSTK